MRRCCRGGTIPGLAGLGLRPGDVFAILAPNSPEWLLACYGALAAGGVVTGITAANLRHGHGACCRSPGPE